MSLTFLLINKSNFLKFLVKFYIFINVRRFHEKIFSHYHLSVRRKASITPPLQSKKHVLLLQVLTSVIILDGGDKGCNSTTMPFSN